MFQAKKWSWKRVAANLLLVPVLAGGSVAVVHAQFGRNSSSGSTLSSMPAMPNTQSSKPTRAASTGDPKQILKDGRKALAEGRFAEAQDLAQAAESNNPSNKWGLFDDTPAALRKDIQAAMHKANKVQSAQLMKQAKTLASQRAGSEAERAYNLDSAIAMVRKADQLHGPYSAWEWNDRADKLLKDLQAERSKLKVVVAKPNPALPTNHDRTAGNRTAMPTGNSGMFSMTANDPKKGSAVKLLNEGRTLADQGNFAAAKVKYMEADKLGAHFAPNEFSPGYALQDLNTRGAGAMDRLIKNAEMFSTKKDYARANASLNQAGVIANSLGLFPKPVDEAKQALFVASSGQFGKASAGGIVAATGQEYLVPAEGPGGKAPSVPPGTQTVYNNGKPGTLGGTVTGRQLLEQADYEFKKGEFVTAQRLAIQAHNQGMQKEAAQLLNSIDAEVLARKKRVASESVASAKTAFDQKDYKRSVGILVLIEPQLLAKGDQQTREKLLADCKAELAKSGEDSNVVATSAVQPPDMGPLPQGGPVPNADNPPGKAHVGSDNPTSQADALRSLAFQKLRSEGLKILTDARASFGRGETDLAMQMLVDHANRVRTAGLDAGSVSRLIRPVESQLDTFRMMKGQTDAIARQNKERSEARQMIAERGIVEEERKREVAALVRQYHDLVKKSDYARAERVALQAKQLDPDDPAITALYEMAKLTGRVKQAEKDKRDKEDFFLKGLNDNDRVGPLVTTDDPVAIKLERLQIARMRGSLDGSFTKTRTPTEYEIELNLDKPIQVEFNQTPLDQVIENLRTLTKLPLVLDDRAMREEGISSVQLITVKPGTAVAAKNILAFALEQAGLSYVIEHDMVKITTTKNSKGRMVTKVFSVADLVTPVPNFALPDYVNFEKMLNRNALNSGNLVMNGGATPYAPTGGLGGGQTASNPLPGMVATSPGIQSPSSGNWQGGTLQTNSPLAGSSSVTNANNNKQEQLIKLITSMVRPYSWDGHGGGGKIEYFDIGSALVVNQTADVITEVQDLLEALRRLQDLAVAVEVRIVSLAESFFERMGVDFSVNIKTNNTSFEPALTSGNFRPQPFINSLNGYNATVGLTPAGTFTPDLNVPIQATSFQRAIPGFGNYPNSPGNNGGISFGLAFLNDIQVYTFMELAQGDQRTNIMSAPKLTLFNGQTATLNVSDLQFFVTSVQVFSVNGQVVFIPQQSPLPGPGSFLQGGSLTITVQAVVSADRRFVRMNLPVNMSVQSGASVPLFPITTFITPVFEGGSQGQPIPFTQFLQQPAFTTLSVQTTVVCPDGGTVLLGGLKTLAEGRNEFGPPFLSKIPYLNRLFKNVGVGRESRHVMIMVTPRIIINSEEEIFQTEGRLPGQNAGGQ